MQTLVAVVVAFQLFLGGLQAAALEDGVSGVSIGWCETGHTVYRLVWTTPDYAQEGSMAVVIWGVAVEREGEYVPVPLVALEADLSGDEPRYLAWYVDTDLDGYADAEVSSYDALVELTGESICEYVRRLAEAGKLQ